MSPKKQQRLSTNGKKAHTSSFKTSMGTTKKYNTTSTVTKKWAVKHGCTRQISRQLYRRKEQ
jgi:hypothetical protein